MNWLSIIQLILQLAPSLLTMVTTVEASVGSGNGAAKKAMVMAPLEGAPPEIVTAASALVDNLVASQKSVVAPAPAIVNPPIVNVQTPNIGTAVGTAITGTSNSRQV